MRFVIAALCFTLVAATAPARAEVATATPGGFVIRSEAALSADPEAAWRALARPRLWWSSAHTYSGDSGNLGLRLRAGGCWCERWGGQSVEHARVVMVLHDERTRTLRLIGAFGPLQAMAATGIMTFTVAPDDQGAKITVEYRVSGDPNVNFDQLASPVDAVLMEQFARFVRLLTAGAPD